MIVLIILISGVVLGIASMGFQLRKRHEPPTMESRYLMKFGLKPGERHGEVWSGAHRSGAPIILTVTTMGDLVMSPNDSDGPPVRISGDEASAMFGASVAVHGPTLPPMTEVTLAAPAHPPFTVLVDPDSMPAIKRWATTRS